MSAESLTPHALDACACCAAQLAVLIIGSPRRGEHVLQIAEDELGFMMLLCTRCEPYWDVVPMSVGRRARPAGCPHARPEGVPS